MIVLNGPMQFPVMTFFSKVDYPATAPPLPDHWNPKGDKRSICANSRNIHRLDTSCRHKLNAVTRSWTTNSWAVATNPHENSRLLWWKKQPVKGAPILEIIKHSFIHPSKNIPAKSSNPHGKQNNLPCRVEVRKFHSYEIITGAS